jgi:phosphoglycerol transferase MdoB-like AlkP superfamily enzyme
VVDRYLSLIKRSDAELKNLIQYFEAQDEDTIIVFFGDHQPNDYMANKVYKLSGKTTVTEEDAKNRYIVPYVIWANYDIKEGTKEDTDISFLAAKALQAAGISTNPYFSDSVNLNNKLDSALSTFFAFNIFIPPLSLS